MRVKLNSARVGHICDAKGRKTGEFAQAAGDVVDMPDDEAKRYIQKGLAQEVKQEHRK